VLAVDQERPLYTVKLSVFDGQRWLSGRRGRRTCLYCNCAPILCTLRTARSLVRLNKSLGWAWNIDSDYFADAQVRNFPLIFDSSFLWVARVSKRSNLYWNLNNASSAARWLVHVLPKFSTFRSSRLWENGVTNSPHSEKRAGIIGEIIDNSVSHCAIFLLKFVMWAPHYGSSEAAEWLKSTQDQIQDCERRQNWQYLACCNSALYLFIY